MPYLSVVIPAHNEEKNIKKCVLSVTRHLKRITKNYRIIISEDGSSDGTFDIAEKMAKNDKRIKVFHSSIRLGKGGGITRAVKEINDKIIITIDADLATDMRHLKDLVKTIKNGYDIAIGSRLLKDSVVKRSFSRDLFSRGYNFLVRLLLKSSIRDHQCGFKAFKRDVITNLIKNTKNMSWFWDTEILVRAQRKGYMIKEIPIKWKEARESKIRLCKDVFNMFVSLIKFWWDIRNE